MPKYDKLPAKSVLDKWAEIRAWDRIALPLIPQVGLDIAYRKAIQSTQCAAGPIPAKQRALSDDGANMHLSLFD